MGYANLRPVLEQRKAEAQRFADDHRGLFEGMGLRGLSRRQMVVELNQHRMPARRGGLWSLCQVQRVIKTLETPWT